MKTKGVKKALDVRQQAYDNFYPALEYTCVCARVYVCVCMLMRICIYVWREGERETDFPLKENKQELFFIPFRSPDLCSKSKEGRKWFYWSDFVTQSA